MTLICFYSSILFAGEIYIWKDKENVINLTDSPPSSTSQVIDIVTYQERLLEESYNSIINDAWAVMTDSESSDTYVRINETGKLQVNSTALQKLLQTLIASTPQYSKDLEDVIEANYEEIVSKFEQFLKDFNIPE